MHKDTCQFLRLFRAIYRPHNYYCVHVDAKSHIDLFVSIQSLARCFPPGHVVIAEPRYDVKWGNPSILHATLLCMQRLLELSRKWKYFINVAAQEFPLKTNLELIRIFKAIKGANIIDGSNKKYAFLEVSIRLIIQFISLGLRQSRGYVLELICCPTWIYSNNGPSVFIYFLKNKSLQSSSKNLAFR